MSNYRLSIRNLRTCLYNMDKQIYAVDGVDIDIPPGEIVCIVGESGCGKSMTSLSIMRLVSGSHKHAISGEIRFEGRDLLKLNEEQMNDVRGKEISMIFQEPMTSLNPVLKIGDQITEVLVRHSKISRKEAFDKAVKMLRIVGIANPEQTMRDYPHRLSGGMRQRVMIAMAMICEPKLLIADEPTTALDVTIQAQVLDLMKQMRDNFQTSILLITHDLGVVSEMADHVFVMYAGQIVESASPDVIFDKPLHPYTSALLASVPTLDKKERLFSIEGVVPDASRYPAGCRFAERCSFRQPSCSENMPMLREIRPDHSVRCDYAERIMEHEVNGG